MHFVELDVFDWQRVFRACHALTHTHTHMYARVRVRCAHPRRFFKPLSHILSLSLRPIWPVIPCGIVLFFHLLFLLLLSHLAVLSSELEITCFSFHLLVIAAATEDPFLCSSASEFKNFQLLLPTTSTTTTTTTAAVADASPRKDFSPEILIGSVTEKSKLCTRY